jgi:NADH:ubiquinone oxidoreductase subunit D
MPFPEAETALASTIPAGDEENFTSRETARLRASCELSRIINHLLGLSITSTKAQQLTECAVGAILQQRLARLLVAKGGARGSDGIHQFPGGRSDFVEIACPQGYGVHEICSNP